MVDTVKNSYWGTVRAMVAFIYLLTSCIIWYRFIIHKRFEKKLDRSVQGWKRSIAAIIALSLVSSALAVQMPRNAKESAIYSGLVGLVIWGFHNLLLISESKTWSWGMGVLDTLFGTIACLATGLILYATFSYRSTSSYQREVQI
jgi:uncharacterized membrane protein